jgi:hypothetical protein
MHLVESMHASPALRKYVRAYAQRTVNTGNAELISKVPARLEQILEFQFNQAFEIRFQGGPSISTPRIAIIGPQTQPRASAVLTGKIESFGAFFQPAGFSQIFGVPMRMLINAGDDGVSVLGQSIRSVWNELGESNSFRARVDIFERFLLRALSSIRGCDRMMEASNRLLALQGRIPIVEIARQESMGIRSFERNFAKKVGVAPKLYARIARFQTALDMKVVSPETTWLTISHALDYHDQMHMVHDFLSLGGDSPGRLLPNLGDMRPQALAAGLCGCEKTSRIFTMRHPPSNS